MWRSQKGAVWLANGELPDSNAGFDVLHLRSILSRETHRDDLRIIHAMSCTLRR